MPQWSVNALRSRPALAALATVLVCGIAVACTPPTPPPPPGPQDLPGDIDLMTDEQVVEALGYMAEEVLAGFDDPQTQEDIPEEARGEVNRILRLLATPDGRAALVEDLRAAAEGVTRGLPLRDTMVDISGMGMAVADFFEPPGPTHPPGVRVPPPTGPGATDGANVNVGPDSSAACRAPDGPGTLAAPDGVRGGQLLSPQHDVYTRTSPGESIGEPGALTPTGVEPIPGQGPGIELSPLLRGSQQMKVVVALEDPKGFGPGALYPLINLKPIGGTPADEFRAVVTDGRIHCYAGDDDPRRGYFEGWVRIPRREPGFQVIVEVVENDWWFRCTRDNLERCDLLLSAGGPQYFAGADRATVHAGPPPVTSAGVMSDSVGAFATGLADGTPGPNVLSETNGERADDIEAAVTAFIDRMIREKVNGALAGDLLQLYVATVQAQLNRPLETALDLRFTTPHDGFSVPDEPVGVTGALRADVNVEAGADLYIQIAGVPCTAITATVEVNLKGNAWADAVPGGTGLTPRLVFDVDSDVDLDMPKWAWLDPTCVIARGLSALSIGEYFIEDAVEDGLTEAFLPHFAPTCLANPMWFHPGGQPVNPNQQLPEFCYLKGTLQALLEGFDLNDHLPTVSIAGTQIRPVVTDIDNTWCKVPGAPAGCTGDQDLIGKEGVGVVADATIISSLGDALGLPLSGRFRNVFAPTIQSTAAELTQSHRDAQHQLAGLGVVIDPRLVNLTLRHLAQGSSTNRTTNGLFDVTDVALPSPGWKVSTRPEVAPMVLGVPDPGPVVCPDVCPPSQYPNPPSRSLAAVALPDLRVDLATGPGEPIELSVATTVNAGADFDAHTKKLRPIIDAAQIDVQVVAGCQADYGNGYAASYALCGRGTGGNGGPTSLTDLITYVVNQVVLPTVTDSIGGISLPSLDGIVPGLRVSLDRVRFSQRGGFITVAADLRPTPRVEIAASTEGYGDATRVRFYPRLWNIDVGLPTTYSWSVSDAVTGLPVATAPFPAPGEAGVSAPMSAFAETATNFGPGKRVAATLTVRQANLEVTASTTFDWWPPAPPPNNPCAPSGIPLRAGPAAMAAPVGPVTPNAAPGCR